jgi:hypothetical protein
MAKPVNLYHCGVHKAATTFFRKLFDDNVVRKRLGRQVLHYETQLKGKWPEKYSEQTPVVVPEGPLVVQVCCNYYSFEQMSKHPDYRGFYVYRDPRELVVSSYWSWLKSHGGGHPNRQILQGMSKDEGMKWTIDWLHDYLDCFNAMVSWATCLDDKIKVWKFEDFFESDDSQNRHVAEMFNHLEIEMSELELEMINRKYSFSALSGGRARGEQNTDNHFRSGTAATWREELSKDVLLHMRKQVGDIYSFLGYEEE